MAHPDNRHCNVVQRPYYPQGTAFVIYPLPHNSRWRQAHLTPILTRRLQQLHLKARFESKHYFASEYNPNYT
jgi:hypothetical protein